MLPKTAIALLALVGLTVCSNTAHAQFAPAIAPPIGFVPTGPSQFPPLTIPPAPAGWVGTVPTQSPTPPSTPTHHRVYKVYYRVSTSSPWVFYASFHQLTDAAWAANNLRAAGYGAYFH